MLNELKETVKAILDNFKSVDNETLSLLIASEIFKVTQAGRGGKKK